MKEGLKMAKYTMITGASSGIGYETALKFAERGNNLIIVARNEEKLKALKESIATKNPELDVIIKTADLADSQNVYKLYEDVKNYDLQTLVNNAGFGDFGNVKDVDLDKIQKMIHLNVEALTILTTLFVKDYEDVEDTQVINVSSVGGYEIYTAALTYSATKYYVAAYTEGLDVQLRDKGAKMRAKVIAPSSTQASFMGRSLDTSGTDYNEVFDRYNTSEELAGYILDLYDSNDHIGIVDDDTLELKVYDHFYPVNNFSG